MSTEVQFNLYDFSEETLEFLYNLPAEFPPSAHKHVVADITDLPDLVGGTGTISVGAIEAIGLDVEEDATINGTLNADDIQGNLTGSVYVSVQAGETLLKGYPVYISGTYTSGDISLPIVSRADSSDPAKMPAVGIMDADLGTGYNGNMVISGRVSDFNTNAYNLNAELYVASGGGFTATAPTTRAQVVARVERKDSNFGSVIVSIDSISSIGNSITSATTSDGTAQLDIASLGFNTSSALTSGVGELVWNDVDGTLDLGLKGGNVTLQIGQESVTRVVNKTGANLLESQYRVVRIRSTAEGGSQGQRLAIVLAQANNDPNSVDTLGIVTENITVNQEGFITTSGIVRGINTTGSLQGETWVDGDVLYLSPTTPGVLTKVKPIAPQHTIIVGFVIYSHAIQGKIYVKVDNGYEIDELHNIKITDVANNNVLKYNGTLNVWENTNSLSLSSLVIGATTPNTKAALDIQSTTQGFLPPRMTAAARDAITTPPPSLIVYNTSTNAINLHNGTAWGAALTTHSASFTSATLANAVSDETGSGSLVFGTSPTLTSPTLVGQVELSGQAATNTTSVMTRELALAEEAMNLAFWLFGTNTSGGNSGTGSSQSRSGSTATGWGRTIITSNAMRPGASGGITMRGDVPIAVSYFGAFDVQQATNGGVVRIIVGDPGNNVGTPPRFGSQEALVARGFGAEVYYSTANSRQEVRLFAFESGVYVVSAGVAFANAYQGTHTLVVSSDGLGNIRLYGHTTGSSFLPPQRPVLLASLSGGPSGSAILGGSHVTIVAANHGTVAPTSGDALAAVTRTKVVIGQTSI